jgi:hypothetical protein
MCSFLSPLSLTTESGDNTTLDHLRAQNLYGNDGVAQQFKNHISLSSMAHWKLSQGKQYFETPSSAYMEMVEFEHTRFWNLNCTPCR